MRPEPGKTISYGYSKKPIRTRFVIILVVFALSLGYVLWHLWRIVPGGWPRKLAAVLVFMLWFGVAVAGFGLTEKVSIKTATVLYEAGLPWMIAFLYLLLLFFAADLLSLCHILPKGLLDGSLAGLGTVIGIVVLIMIAGNIHYKHKYREELTIKTEKPLEKPLTVVLASDLHVGYHNRRAELARWVDLINALKELLAHSSAYVEVFFVNTFHL